MNGRASASGLRPRREGGNEAGGLCPTAATARRTLRLHLGGPHKVAAGVWASPWLSVRQNLKNHKLAFKPQTWPFSSSGVQVEANGARSSFDWAVVTRLVEHSGYLHLYVSEGMAYAIPKRALPSQELEELKNAFRQWLGPRAEVA